MKGGREGHMEDGNVVMGQREECGEGNKRVGMWLWSIGTGGEGREEIKALGMQLWSIGRGAERRARKGECGCMSKEGHRQGTKLLGKRLRGIGTRIDLGLGKREYGYGAKG
jgi:hypothetical protein